MEDLHDFLNKISSIVDYDEKLEEEYIIRARSIFDDFVIPGTGVFVVCTFTEIFNGLDRLWSLAQEMKSQTNSIHERLINLPLLFMIILFRMLEQEYTSEDFEKVAHDPVLSEAFLKLFTDLSTKSVYFTQPRDHKVMFSACIIYSRHIIDILNADPKVKRIKWTELRVRKCKIQCPFRAEDVPVIREALIYFKTHVLPNYSKQPVQFNLVLKPKYPEIMEPTYELQSNIADFLNLFSIVLFFSSLIFAILIFIVDERINIPTDDQ